MLIGEIIAVALSAIRANKLRSFLTSLGIIIGVSAVIAMVALGTGAQKAVEDQIQNLGADIVSVYSGQSFSRGVASSDRVALTTDDADALMLQPRYIKEVVPELSRSMQVTYGNQNINVSIIGTTPNWDRVQRYEIIAGRMFSEGDNEARRRVAVIGWGVPEQVGANGVAMIGQTV